MVWNDGEKPQAEWLPIEDGYQFMLGDVLSVCVLDDTIEGREKWEVSVNGHFIDMEHTIGRAKRRGLLEAYDYADMMRNTWGEVFDQLEAITDAMD